MLTNCSFVSKAITPQDTHLPCCWCGAHDSPERWRSNCRIGPAPAPQMWKIAHFSLHYCAATAGDWEKCPGDRSYSHPPFQSAILHEIKTETGKKFSKSVSQSINQSITRSINRLTNNKIQSNEPLNQPINRTNNHQQVREFVTFDRKIMSSPSDSELRWPLLSLPRYTVTRPFIQAWNHVEPFGSSMMI